MTIENTLQERGKRSREFTTQANISQSIKWAFHQTDNWVGMAQTKKKH